MTDVDKSKKIMTLDNLTYYDSKIKGYINGKYVEVSTDLDKLQKIVEEVEGNAVLVTDDIILNAN